MRKINQAFVPLLLIASATCMMASAQVTVEQGLRLEQQHRYKEARDAYTTILENHPQHPDAHYWLGLLDLRQFKNIDSAVEHLQNALELDGQNAEYHFILAEAYAADLMGAGIFRKLSLMKKARRHLQRAVQFDPDNVLYLEGLVQYYAYVPGILGGSNKKARQHADSIAAIDLYAGLLAHAWILGQEGKRDQALMFYRKALDLDPVDGRGYYRLGYYYVDEEQYDEAITEFKKYIEVAPDTAESYHSLGEAYFRTEQYRKAINRFLLALQRDSWHASSIYRLAQCYERLGSYDESLRHYEKYVALVPAGRRVDDARGKISELSARNP